MNSTNTNFEYKTFNTNTGQYLTRRYVKIKASTLEEYMGTDKDDVREALGSNTTDGYGFFISKTGKFTNKYASGLISGSIPSFKNNEIEIVRPPAINECSMAFLKLEVYKHSDVLSYHPDRRHKKGPHAGKIILDDISFTASIFSKLRPFDYKNWVKMQTNLNKKRITKDEANLVDVDFDWLEKIKAQNKTIHKKGKSGVMISGCQKRETFKRKRAEFEKEVLYNDLKDDKVWFPPSDLVQEAEVPQGKEFVSSAEYKKAKDKTIEFNNILKASIDNAVEAAFSSVQHFETLEKRKYQYDLCRDKLHAFYSKHGEYVATYDEACTKFEL